MNAAGHVVRREPAAAESACAKPVMVAAAGTSKRGRRKARLGETRDALPRVLRSCGQMKVEFT